MGKQTKVIWKDLSTKDRVELFCEMIGRSIPLIGGGMAWVADAPFVITVSKYIPQMLGSGTMDYEFLRDQIRIIRAALQPGQNWGVNLILFTGSEKDDPKERERLGKLIDKRIDVIVEEGGVPFVATGAGILTQPRARKLKDAGSTLIAVIGQPRHAKLARRAGYDIIVAERRCSGGHVGPMDEGLIEQTVEMVPDMPVVGAGGIGDAETFAEVLNLGACGGQIGTALIATSDTDTDEEYKQRIVSAKGPDATTITAIDDILQIRAL
ncbi:MAG TPA: nitronate monooxygenase, partial [Anaerolineae bacterium]|nr:nitronate monooxygenase [Anaerolineae bacterium]